MARYARTYIAQFLWKRWGLLPVPLEPQSHLMVRIVEEAATVAAVMGLRRESMWGALRPLDVTSQDRVLLMLSS